jgi:uncharacterized membrane protein YdjX (TVP38/TMEM64 family)
VLGLVAVLLPLAGLAWLAERAEGIGQGLQSLGVVGGLALTIVGGVLCGLAVLPTHALSLMAGFALGMAWGGPVAVLAVVLAAAIGHATAGWLGGCHLAEILQQRRVGRVLWDAMVGVGGWRCGLAVALVRLPPQVPFALANVIAAGVGVPWRAFLIGTALGMTPRVLLVVWAGSLLRTWSRDEPIPAATWLSVLGAGVALVGLGFWAWRVMVAAQATANASAQGQESESTSQESTSKPGPSASLRALD